MANAMQLRRREDGEKEDELLDPVVRMTLAGNKASVVQIQRYAGVGYFRATRLVELMAAAGVVSDDKERKVLITLEEWEARKRAEK